MIKPFLGIAFGGGGVRGAAHVGVLQELHKAGITADIVSGVSAGSIVAGMYAMSLDPFKLELFIFILIFFLEFNKSLLKSSTTESTTL